MKFNYSYLLALVLALTTVSAQNCVRNPYMGGPQNAIIKATETVNDLLQVANTDTNAIYIDTLQGIAADGSAFNDYIFTVEDTVATITWVLIIRVSTYQNFTFVDDYIFMDLADGNTEALLTAYNADIDNTYFTDLSNGTLNKNCNLVKESFTYFYELFGDRFRQDLNN